MTDRRLTRTPALALGGAIALGLAATAAAGEPEIETAEEIIVTGSRVRGAEPVGSPVITMDRASIDASSQVTVDRMIKEIPQNFDLGVSENSRGQSGGAGNIVYGNTVNLRGIGPYATLVLVDGHRVVNNSRSVDPSVLPTLGVERIEVVADGASAIYGSDAVAGVVNILPRRSLDGFEVFGRAGMSEDGDFDELIAGLAFGTVFDRGQVMVAFEHAERNNLSGDDRDFFRGDQTAFGGRDYRVMQCAPGTLRIGTTTYAIPAGGVTQANAGALVAGSANRCDQLPGQDLFPSQRYNTANATATFELTDSVALFGDGFYSLREFIRQPGYATATLSVPQTNAWFVRPAGFAGTAYQVDYSFRENIARNTSIGSARNWQFTPGVRLALPGDWQVEGIVTYGENHDESTTLHGLNNAALNAALASSNPATAFDPYGLNRTSAATLEAVSDQIFVAPTLSQMLGYEGRVNGELFDLPGGAVGLAAGYEHQDIDVDLGSARGGPTTPTTFRSFNRKVNSGYLELLLPLFGAPNSRSGLQRLTLDAAVRYDDYSDVGDTTNSKFGLSWAPVQSLTVRGTWGTSFRAPLISQIYGNSNNLFNQNYQNPAGGAALPGVALSGENQSLQPEEAETWTVGADFDVTADLRLSLTYFDVLYESQVESYLSNLAILARESEFEGTGIILRGTAARDRVLELLAQGIAPVGTFPGGSPNNVTLFVDGRSSNLGKSITRGFDAQASYRLPTGGAGSFRFDLNGSYLTEHDVAITAVAPLVDRLDVIFNPLRFKARLSSTWDYGSFRTLLAVTHVGGYINNATTPIEDIDSYTPVDLGFAWTIGGRDGGEGLLGGLVLGVEVRNLLDDDPPYVNLAPSVNGSGGYDASASNPVGRQYGISLRKSF